MFTEQRTFGNSRWPFTLARPEAVDYAPERFPGTLRVPRLASSCCPGTSATRRSTSSYVADAIRAAAAQLIGSGDDRATSRDLRFGLVGAGGIAQAYVQVFEAIAGATHHRGRRRRGRGAPRASPRRCAAPRYPSHRGAARGRRRRRGARLHAAGHAPRDRAAVHRARAATCCARSRSRSTSAQRAGDDRRGRRSRRASSPWPRSSATSTT